MSGELTELAAATERVSDMRRDVIRQVNEVFAALKEVLEGDNAGGLVRVAEKFQRERDEALARIEELESELVGVKRDLASRPPVTERQKHAASIKDAAITLRATMKGVADSPLTDVGSARIVGQVNKAVVAFDEATEGML